jgi:hypothetical protein
MIIKLEDFTAPFPPPHGMPTSFLYHGFGPVGYDYVPTDAQEEPLYFWVHPVHAFF